MHISTRGHIVALNCTQGDTYENRLQGVRRKGTLRILRAVEGHGTGMLWSMP